MWYKLDEDNNPIECSMREYTKWLDKNPTKKAVRQEEIGKSYVSTVFLGLDHGYKQGIPVLYETMIFGGKHDQYQERYTSLEDAVKGHKVAVELVKKDRYGIFHSIWNWISNGCNLRS